MDSIGLYGLKALVEGASNIPARSPKTRRRMAWARSRAASPSRPASRPPARSRPRPSARAWAMSPSSGGRPLAAARAEAASSATSSTVCSMGRRSRPSTVRAREPSSSRRRLRTSPSHSASGTDAGLGAASKGFNLPGSPGPSAMDVPPKAAATALHSPLGSHGTYTR